jgi:hypothetical protein
MSPYKNVYEIKPMKIPPVVLEMFLPTVMRAIEVNRTIIVISV